jgi:hypothetical protein
MWEAIKNTVLWNYGRTTWQYDVLCILILAFIFLTPKSWFEGRERNRLPSENQQITRLIVGAESFSSNLDENAKLQRVRELSGNPNAQIANWSERRDANGKTLAYEIEVR